MLNPAAISTAAGNHGPTLLSGTGLVYTVRVGLKQWNYYFFFIWSMSGGNGRDGEDGAAGHGKFSACSLYRSFRPPAIPGSSANLVGAMIGRDNSRNDCF